MKKILCLVLAFSIMLTMAFAVSVNAATKWAIDLSAYNDGDMYYEDGRHYKTFVVEEDGKKAVLFSQAGTSYGTSSLTDNVTLFVNNQSGLPDDTKGIIMSATFKTSSTGHLIILSPGYNTTPRYVTASSGKFRIDGTGTNTDTGLTYSANSWVNTKLSINFATGYYIFEVTDLATGIVSKYASTNANFVKTCDAATMAAFQKVCLWKDSSAGDVYLSELSVESVNDAEAIAPSRTLIRDDFNNNTNTLSGWSGSGTVATTDRGKSALIDCATAEIRMYQPVTLPSDVKGLVSEFSVKLSTTSGTEFIYAADNADWYSGAKRLLQFASNGKITAFNGGIEARTYSADTWYDIRVENNFTNGFTRISIFDGLNETVVEKKYEALSTTYASPADIIKRFEFVSSSATTKSIYIDDINIYWLNATEVSGLENPRTYATSEGYTVHNEFENFTEGNMQDDLLEICPDDNYTAFRAEPVEGEFEIGIESVANSGRGKSFKASNLTGTQPRQFTGQFIAFKNGVAEYDIMLENNTTNTELQYMVSNSGSHNLYYTLFRFTSSGTITDESGNETFGTYEGGKWYHIIVTAGTFEVEGVNHTAVFAQAYGDAGLVAEDLVVTDADSTSRDSLHGVKYIINGVNTVYVDNFKMYINTGAQGLFPTPSHLLRNKSVAPDGALTIAFSKVINLANSKFKVNGDEVSATLLGGNVVKLNKAITEGETYEIEYKAADIDGYTASGYIGNITVPRALIIEDYSAATLESPSASVKVTINSANTAKKVQLIVAAYNEAETRLLDIDVQTAAANAGEQTLTATVEATGATKLKTFLWEGASLTPIEIQ